MLERRVDTVRRRLPGLAPVIGRSHYPHRFTLDLCDRQSGLPSQRVRKGSSGLGFTVLPLW